VCNGDGTMGKEKVLGNRKEKVLRKEVVKPEFV
jgi:hypothetical protein